MKHNAPIQQGSSRAVYLTIGLLLTVVLIAIGTSLYAGNKAALVYAPLVDAAMEVKLEAAIGHLWFEEILSGDRHENIETVWQHLEQSSWYAQAMLEGGTNDEGTYIPLQDATLRREIEGVVNKLSQFRTVAEQRYAAREQAAAGTTIDEQFDAIFRDFMKQADSVETALQKLMHRARNRFITMQSGLAALCLAIAGLVVVVFRREREKLITALEDVQANEQKAQLTAELVMNSNQPVAVGFADGRLGQLNPAFCKLTGYTELELQAIDWSTELTPPEWLPAERETLAELERTGEPVRYEKEYIRKEGTRVPIELFVHLARNAAGQPDYYYAFITDITQRKQADRMFKSFFEQPMSLNLIATFEGIIVHTNSAWLTILGYPPEELNGTSFFDFVHPDDLEITNADLEKVKQGKTTFHFKNRYRHKNGSYRTLAWTSVPSIEDQRGYAMAIDVTEQDRAEEALRNNEARFRDVIETAMDGFWRTNRSGRFIEVNLAYCQMVGYSQEELLGLGISDVEAAETDDELAVHLQKVITQGKDRFETRHRRKDGRIIVVEICAQIDQVERDGMVVFIRDITERKQTELELKKAKNLLEKRVEERTSELKVRKDEAETLNRAMINVLGDLKQTNLGLEIAERSLLSTNKELEAFSYSVSHDLRAPLRHIDGFVGLLLKREKSLDPTSARYLDTIAHASGRMGRLIDDLLAFSRTSRSKMRTQRIDQNEVIQQTLKDLSSMTEGRQIKWEIADLPLAQADGSLIRQVWENLIGNAIKYTGNREQAQIEIGTTREGNNATGEIVFFIRDNGAGFDPQYTDKLFGVFQRLHREDEFEGTGIGLATVARIVHRHGGRVWAVGAVDQGATFYFTLKEAKGTG